MLVLSRKRDQRLVLGDDITITVLSIDGDRVKLGIDAPRTVPVLRHEVYLQVQAANASAAIVDGSGATARSIAALLRAQPVLSATECKDAQQ